MFFEAFALNGIDLFLSKNKKSLDRSRIIYALRIIQGAYVIRCRKSLHVFLENNLIIKKEKFCKFFVALFFKFAAWKKCLIYWIFSGSISSA